MPCKGCPATAQLLQLRKMEIVGGIARSAAVRNLTAFRRDSSTWRCAFLRRPVRLEEARFRDRTAAEASNRGTTKCNVSNLQGKAPAASSLGYLGEVRRLEAAYLPLFLGPPAGERPVKQPKAADSATSWNCGQVQSRALRQYFLSCTEPKERCRPANRPQPSMA